MTADNALDADIARQVVPVNHAPPTPAAPPPDGRGGKRGKLQRRIDGLPPGRWLLVVSIDERGPQDWSVQMLGKIEQ